MIISGEQKDNGCGTCPSIPRCKVVLAKDSRALCALLVCSFRVRVFVSCIMVHSGRTATTQLVCW